MKIARNRIRCRSCREVIESTHVHDFKWCKCGKIAVDGGTDYLRRVGEVQNMDELSEYIEERDDESI